MAEAGAPRLNEHFRGVGLHNAMYVIPLCSVLLAAGLLGPTRTVSRDIGELQIWMSTPTTTPPAGQLPATAAPYFLQQPLFTINSPPATAPSQRTPGPQP